MSSSVQRAMRVQSCEKVALLVAMVALIGLRVGAQADRANHDPDAAQIVTTDISRFWKAFDDAGSTTDEGEVFQREYLDGGSAGLQDFIPNRILSGHDLAQAVAARPRYLASVRANTLALDARADVKDAIHAAYRNLKEVYPSAVFPDVYFVMGRFTSGGTTSSHGLLMGVEMNARDADTPLDELTPWERTSIGRVADLPYVVAHELVHFQQRMSSSGPLLQQAVREGAADFVGELISGEMTTRAQHAYGDAHEAELWAEFSQQMDGRDASHWLYQGNTSTDRPADLGYYVGYQICRALYERSIDKREAIRLILEADDAAELLRASQYAGHL